MEPYHQYLDLDFLNNDFSSGAAPRRLEFGETRNTPFLDGDSSNYFCSIVRFSIQTGSGLPVFIPRIEDPTVDKHITIYKITLTYSTFQVTVPVIYTPGEAATNLLTAGKPVDQSIGSDYYYVKDYRDFIEMVNTAFKTAFTTLTSRGPPVSASFQPFLDFDPITYKVILHTESLWFNPAVTANPVKIYFNSRLHELFVGLRSTFLTNTGDMNYRMDVKDPYNINQKIVTFPNGTKYTFTQTYQTLSSISLWNPVASIVFCTTMLPIVPNQTSKANIVSNQTNDSNSGGNNSVVSNIISDFEISVEANNQYRGTVLYAPSAEYRLVDMFPGTDLNKVNIQVFWKDQFSNLNPLYVTPGCSAHLKLLFRRKDYNVT